MQLLCDADDTGFTPMDMDVLEQNSQSKLLLCASQSRDDNRNIHVLNLHPERLFSTRTRIRLPPDGWNKETLPNTTTLHGHVRFLLSAIVFRLYLSS